MDLIDIAISCLLFTMIPVLIVWCLIGLKLFIFDK